MSVCVKTALVFAGVSGVSLIASMINGVNYEATLVVFVSSFFISVCCCWCDRFLTNIAEDFISSQETVQYVVHIEQPDLSSAIGVSEKINLIIE